MTGENNIKAKVFKVSEHNRMRAMRKNDNNLAHMQVKQWAKMRRFYNVCRIDFESQYTINDYNEKESDTEWIETGTYNNCSFARKSMHVGEGIGEDVVIGDSAMNVYGDLHMKRIYSNGDESFLNESNSEFDRRQWRLLQILKNQNKRNDLKYKKSMRC